MASLRVISTEWIIPLSERPIPSGKRIVVVSEWPVSLRIPSLAGPIRRPLAAPGSLGRLVGVPPLSSSSKEASSWMVLTLQLVHSSLHGLPLGRAVQTNMSRLSEHDHRMVEVHLLDAVLAEIVVSMLEGVESDTNNRVHATTVTDDTVMDSLWLESFWEAGGSV